MNGSTGSALATWNLGNGIMELNIRTGSSSNNFGALIGGVDTVLSGRSASDNNGPTTHYIGGNGLSTTFDGSIRNGSLSAQILSIVKVGGGTLSLSGVSTYTGRTEIREGGLRLIDNGSIDYTTNIQVDAGAVLDASQRSDGSLNLGLYASSLLTGSGTVRGSVVQYSGTINPGDTIGTLIITNMASLYGTVLMELNRSTVAKNDKLVAGSFAVGATLIVTNVGPDLHNGDTFQLFNTGVSGFAVQLPATDSTATATYVWDDKIATDGSIQLVSGGLPPVNTTPTNVTFSVSGGQMTLTWPTDHIGWRLQAQTNSLNVGLSSNWVDVAGSSATNRVDLPVSTTDGAVFFRLVYP